MRVRNLDINWDWTFGKSQINYLRFQNAINKDIQMRLYEWFRDCFFALNKGIPWNIRLGHHNQKELLDRDIQNVVAGTTGVLNLSDFESYVLDRRYRCQMNIYTQYSSSGTPFVFETEI